MLEFYDTIGNEILISVGEVGRSFGAGIVYRIVKFSGALPRYFAMFSTFKRVPAGN